MVICPQFRERLYESGPKGSSPAQGGLRTWDDIGMYLVSGITVYFNVAREGYRAADALGTYDIQLLLRDRASTQGFGIANPRHRF